MNFLHTTAMDSCCKGICGLAASLELKYVLVVPTEQATKLHDELLRRGVPERLIYVVDPNRRPRAQNSTNCEPTVEASGSGGRTRGQEKRFMPGSIRLGTYAAGGQQYNVGLRRGYVWISMIDRAPGADGGGASEVTVADGGGASEVSPVVGSRRSAEVPPVVDRGVAVGPVPKEDSCMTIMNMPMESDGGHETDDDNITVLGGDCENDNDEPKLSNGGRRCNSSSMLCEDCKQWLLKEYFGDRLQDEVSDLAGQHACIYKRIVDRLFVVTVTESGGAGDDEDDDEDEDATACCGTTTADDGVVERPPTATDRTEREQPFAGPTTPSQPAPPMEHSTTPSVPEDQVDHVEKKAEKPKKKSFFSKFCKSNKKTKTN